MSIPGYAGNILYVDLTAGRIWKEPLDTELAGSFVGGWGFTQRLAWDLIPPRIDPLSPQNAIIIGTGPLNGTAIPGSSEVSLTTKVPLNGSIYTGCGGGHFAMMLKSSGYDCVVITGRAARPVYLKVGEDSELCDASDLWGRDMFETVDELRARHEPCSVIPIGQAGENLVNISVTTIDKGGTVGGGGFPAVMGSKKLKAVVAVQGNQGIRIAHPERLQRLSDEMLGRIRAYHLREELMAGGAMAMTARWRGGETGAGTTKNFTELMPIPPNAADNMAALYDIHKRSRSKLACPTCPMADKDRIDLKEGKCAGMVVYDTAVMTTPTIAGTADAYGEALQRTSALNRYGIDRWFWQPMLDLMTCFYEQGLINKGDTGGIELKRDMQIATELELLKMAAMREGFGDVVALGPVAACLKLGRGLAERVNHIKGYFPIAVMEPRINGLGTMEFEMIVHPSRPHSWYGCLGMPSYNRGVPINLWIREAEKYALPQEAIKRIFSASDFNVGRLTRHCEDNNSIFNTLGLCNRLYMGRFHTGPSRAAMYSAVTGRETTTEELRQVGERNWNLFKMLNVREGFTRRDDRPPEAWFEPLKGKEHDWPLMDYYKTRTLTRQDIERLQDDYYDERGWDKVTGAPTPQKLKQLGLESLLSEMG